MTPAQQLLSRKYAFTFFFLVLVATALPVTVLLVGQNQNRNSFAASSDIAMQIRKNVKKGQEITTTDTKTVKLTFTKPDEWQLGSNTNTVSNRLTLIPAAYAQSEEEQCNAIQDEVECGNTGSILCRRVYRDNVCSVATGDDVAACRAAQNCTDPNTGTPPDPEATATPVDINPARLSTIKKITIRNVDGGLGGSDEKTIKKEELLLAFDTNKGIVWNLVELPTSVTSAKRAVSATIIYEDSNGNQLIKTLRVKVTLTQPSTTSSSSATTGTPSSSSGSTGTGSGSSGGSSSTTSTTSGSSSSSTSSPDSNSSNASGSAKNASQSASKLNSPDISACLATPNKLAPTAVAFPDIIEQIKKVTSQDLRYDLNCDNIVDVIDYSILIKEKLKSAASSTPT